MSTSAARVLVVDDDDLLRRFLVTALTRGGYAVETAEDSATARRRLATSPSVDVVLLDGLLPDGRGTDLARDLMDDSATSGIGICFLSGLATEPLPALAGISSILKPATRAVIESAIRDLLDWRGSGGSPVVDRRAALDRLAATLVL